jgi:hypothetical protein
MLNPSRPSYFVTHLYWVKSEYTIPQKNHVLVD